MYSTLQQAPGAARQQVPRLSSRRPARHSRPRAPQRARALLTSLLADADLLGAVLHRFSLHLFVPVPILTPDDLLDDALNYALDYAGRFVRC
ncbi:hypothetical protein [Hymenobacter elongatus]|uniref:Uncharacterized protein n=1 Tax=Hymenobacter elongatus TaxID=877208 RepID=A0A4Z0PSB9_9BACT|nr:hypothetical protein [Hymenobacter elongatus]TGE20204.1 hypothetical protein E5J99_01150 [Hymenobacter elongatus]